MFLNVKNEIITMGKSLLQDFEESADLALLSWFAMI